MTVALYVTWQRLRFGLAKNSSRKITGKPVRITAQSCPDFFRWTMRLSLSVCLDMLEKIWKPNWIYCWIIMLDELSLWRCHQIVHITVCSIPKSPFSRKTPHLRNSRSDMRPMALPCNPSQASDQQPVGVNTCGVTIYSNFLLWWLRWVLPPYFCLMVLYVVCHVCVCPKRVHTVTRHSHSRIVKFWRCPISGQT